MHPDIEKMIRAAARGDSITQQQRILIRNKAITLGEDPDEAELLLELRFSQQCKLPGSSLTRKRIGSYDFHHTGCIYEGEMKDGVAEGKGVVYYPDRCGAVLYQGEFHNGNRHGKGILYGEDGITKCIEGNWVDDEIEGKGIMYWEDGATKMFEGFFHNGCYEGQGILYDRKGHMFYKGDFQHSDFHGKGAIYKNGIKLCEGDFCEGRMICGALFKNGVKIYEGPLPPTEDGIIRPGIRFGGLAGDYMAVFKYLLDKQDNQFKN